MIRYLVNRLGQSLIVVFGVSLFTFFLLHLFANAEAVAALGVRADVPGAIAAFNKAHGLDKPFFVQYYVWVGQIIHGNFGFSVKQNQPVSSLLLNDIPKTLSLMASSYVVALVIAVPLGIWQAVKRNGIADYTLTAASYFVYSMPTFWLGELLIIAFAIYWKWEAALLVIFLIITPITLIVSIVHHLRMRRTETTKTVVKSFLKGFGIPFVIITVLLVVVLVVSQPWQSLPANAPQEQFGQPGFPWSFADLMAYASGLVLPVLTLALVTIAAFSRYMRSSVLENLYQDYVRTARAKGLSFPRTLLTHVLRNSLIPIITLLGLSLPALFSGALITEAVFNYPGMGLLFWIGAQNYDYPVLLAVALIVAITTVIGNLLADILYSIVDPRVRYN